MMYFALIGRFPIRCYYIDKSFYLFQKMYKSLKSFEKKNGIEYQWFLHEIDF